LRGAIANVTRREKLAGRVDANSAARRQKPATAKARWPAKTKEKEFAESQCAEIH
jgi:hypothetical protein